MTALDAIALRRRPRRAWRWQFRRDGAGASGTARWRIIDRHGIEVARFATIGAALRFARAEGR